MVRKEEVNGMRIMSTADGVKTELRVAQSDRLRARIASTSPSTPSASTVGRASGPGASSFVDVVCGVQAVGSKSSKSRVLSPGLVDQRMLSPSQQPLRALSNERIRLDARHSGGDGRGIRCEKRK